MAEVATLPVDPDEEKAGQLELFEGTPVSAYKAALGSAADIEIPNALTNEQEVSFTGVGRVVKTSFHTRTGKGGVKRTTRIATINVEQIEIVEADEA